MTTLRVEGCNMSFATRSVVLVLGALMVLSSGARGQDNKPSNGPASNRNLDDYFAKEVWPKVGVILCVKCHIKGGDAEESKLILQDPRKVQGHAQEEALRHNRDAFARLASVKHKDQSRLLVKVTGGLSHGGDDVLKPGSKGYLILVEFVRRINAAPSTTPRPIVDDKNLPPCFAGVTMLDPNRLLRRVMESEVDGLALIRPLLACIVPGNRRPVAHRLRIVGCNERRPDDVGASGRGPSSDRNNTRAARA